MKRNEELLGRLKNKIQVPDQVKNRIDDTLAFLPEVSSSARHRKRPKRNFTALKIASSAAVLVLIFTVICITNPALAAKIPFLSGIFSSVENQTTYRGNFDEKAEVLVDLDETAGSEEEPSEPEIPTEYTAYDQGIRITASEVYSDGLAVYLTAQLKYDNPAGLTHIPQHYTSYYTDRDTTLAQGIYTRGTFAVNGGIENWLDNVNVEGSAVDDQTFEGMLVLQLGEYTMEDGVIELNFTNFGYDRLDDPVNPDEIANWDNFTDGNWTLTIPYTVDVSKTRVVDVNEYLPDGSGIEKLYVSDHQVIVGMKANSHVREDNEETRALYEELYGEGNEKGVPVGEYSYEEFLAERLYDSEMLHVSIFDKNGKQLPPLYGDLLTYHFTVQGLDVSELYIFAGTDFGKMVEADFEQLKSTADLAAKVQIKE